MKWSAKRELIVLSRNIRQRACFRGKAVINDSHVGADFAAWNAHPGWGRAMPVSGGAMSAQERTRNDA